MKYRAGHVVQVTPSEEQNGKLFVGKRFTLVGEPAFLRDETCWRLPPAWAGGAFVYINESRLQFVHDGNIKSSWEKCYWKPHLEVVRDPTNPDRLVNVWDPLDRLIDHQLDALRYALKGMPPLPGTEKPKP